MRTIRRGRPALPLEAVWVLLGVLAVVAFAGWRCGGGDEDLTIGPSEVAFSTPASGPFASCGAEAPGDHAEFDLEARACLLAAAVSGRRVEFTTTRTTAEGAPIGYRIRILAPRDIEVTVDNRADEFAGPARRRVTTTRCATLEQPDPESPRIVIRACTDGSSYEV